MSQHWEWLVQFGALGVLAGMIYFIFARAIPSVLTRMENLEDKFITALKEHNTTFVRELSEQRLQFSHDLKEIQKINIESYREHKTAIVEALKENTNTTNALQLQLAKNSKDKP